VAVRRRILDQAPTVIARGGKPTVGDFARAAGISRASFYRHFPSREALLAALDVTPEPAARERILSAAVDIVGIQGLTALSMDELADRAEVSRATVYRLFPGKAALLASLIEGYSPLEPVLQTLEQRIDEPPEVLMPEIARTAYRAAAGRVGLVRALFFEISGLSAETEAVARDAINKVVGRLVTYVVAQMSAGRLRKMHPLIALQSLVGPVLFHILTRPLAERVLHLDMEGEAAVTQLAESWLRAMRPEKESKT